MQNTWEKSMVPLHGPLETSVPKSAVFGRARQATGYTRRLSRMRNNTDGC